MEFPSTSEANRVGSNDARRDIAAGKPRLHYEARGAWGQDLKETMLSRFGVEVIAPPKPSTPRPLPTRVEYNRADEINRP